MFKRIDHVEIVTDQLDRTVQFYTQVLGFTVKARDRIERSGLGVPIDLVYLDLGGTVVELISYEGVAVDPAPQTEHLGYRMIALEVDDMEKTADYLKTKVSTSSGAQESGRPIRGRRSAIPTANTSSSGSGSGKPTCSRQARGRGSVQDHLLRSTCIYKTGVICVVMQGTANSLGWAENLAREAGDGWFACDVPVLPDIPEPYSVCIRYFECSQPQRSQ
jgi:predicted enzyme related to lactoylglutathione lyase